MWISGNIYRVCLCQKVQIRLPTLALKPEETSPEVRNRDITGPKMDKKLQVLRLFPYNTRARAQGTYNLLVPLLKCLDRLHYGAVTETEGLNFAVSCLYNKACLATVIELCISQVHTYKKHSMQQQPIVFALSCVINGEN